MGTSSFNIVKGRNGQTLCEKWRTGGAKTYLGLHTRLLRDCISYYKGEGNAEPGSLAYYGGPEKWHEHCHAAQESLDPFVFEPTPVDDQND